jgi:hypothetical protein
MFIDCKQSTLLDIYKVLSGSIVPRPIAWVSTQSVVISTRTRYRLLDGWRASGTRPQRTEISSCPDPIAVETVAVKTVAPERNRRPARGRSHLV